MELSNVGKPKSKMVFKRWLSKSQKHLVFVFLFAAIFTGCNSQSNSSSANSIPISSQNTAVLVEQKSLNIITARSGLYNHACAGNENGCYFTVANEDGSANIMYIDYESLSVLYLSSNIQSTHNTEGNSSWIKNAIGGSTIIMLKNKIGIITFGMPSRKATSNENAARIFTADLDGSNRELLYEFLPNEEIKSAIAFDGEYLYFLVKAYDKMSVNQIVKLDITSKAKEIVATYPDDADYSIVGVSERGLLCKIIGIPSQYSNLPVSELAQYLYTKLILVNVDTGEEEKIFEWNENLFSEIVGEKIYFYSNIDKAI